MSNEEYVTRVSALTRKAIAKYPGLADDIRQKVSTITGLPYADRYKEMEYVKQRFAKEKKDSEFDPMKLVLKDIDDIAAAGKYSRKDLFDMYNNNRAEYDAISKTHNEIKGIAQNVKVVEDTLKTLTAQSDSDANLTRGGWSAMLNGYLGMNVDSAYTTTLENNFKDVLGRMNKGDDIKVNASAFSTQVQFHNAEMRSAINNSRNATLTALDNYLATSPNISDPKRQQLKADINTAADLQLAKYADEKGVGLAAMSVIMVNYRDKTLKEKRDLIDLVVKQVESMKNTPMVMAYYGMGASRENLKRTNKPFYDHMERLEKLQSDATNGIITNEAVYQSLSETAAIIKAADEKPEAVAVSPNADPTNQKAAHAVMQSNAQASLDKAVKGTALDVTEINAISSAQATNVGTGANAQILVNDFKKIGDKIRLLPLESQAIINENVSRAARGNVMSMISMKEVLEAKHGVTLTLGVTPAGQIVAMPTPLSKEEQAQQKALGRAVIPLNDVRRKEPVAINEFNNQSRAMLSNLVFGTAMLVDNKTPVTIANEFAIIINNKQTYDGFYSNAPVVPVATLSDAQLEAQRLKYDADNEKGTVMGLDVTSSLPSAVPPAPVTSNVPAVTKPRSQREAKGRLEPLPKTDKPAVTPAKPSGGNLKVGDVVNGFTYTGGDPNNSSSWKQ
jgi:hypothetical protein